MLCSEDKNISQLCYKNNACHHNVSRLHPHFWCKAGRRVPPLNFKDLAGNGWVLSSWAKRNCGRCQVYSSAGSSKIKIQTSSCNRKQIGLYCMTKSEFWFSMIRPSYRPGNVRNLDPGRVNSQTRAGAPRARAMHKFFSRKFTKSHARPPRGRDAPVPYLSSIQ